MTVSSLNYPHRGLSYSRLSYMWTNFIFVFSDVRRETGFFFFNGSCHSTQEDERQGPLDVVLYNKQDKHLTDTKSL